VSTSFLRAVFVGRSVVCLVGLFARFLVLPRISFDSLRGLLGTFSCTSFVRVVGKLFLDKLFGVVVEAEVSVVDA
jgi:hypothetical protein